jgi:hypothetical protein
LWLSARRKSSYSKIRKSALQKFLGQGHWIEGDDLECEVNESGDPASVYVYDLLNDEW